MERKLIFLDTDGTLVSALSSPTPAVAEAIQAQISLVGSLAEVVEEINKSPVVKNESTRLTAMRYLRQNELTIIGEKNGKTA